MILITKPRVTSGGVYTFVENITPFLGADTVVFLRGNKVGNANKLLRLFYSIVNPFVFIKTLILRNPDEVIINTSLSFSCLLRDGVLVFISKLFQKKVLLIIHGFQEAALGHWALLKAGYFRADAITVLANEFKEKLRSTGYGKPVSILYNPVDKELLDQGSVTISNRIVNVLFMARIEKNKGVDIAIEAFISAAKKFPHLKLHIAGTGTEYNALLSRYSSNKSIHFYGFVTGAQKKELLLSSDLFLFPTYYEGLPISILEAMSAGHYIITRPVGGLKDLFLKHNFGYCVDSLEVKEFAKALCDAIDHEADCLTLRRANRKFAQEHFNPARVANAIKEILNKINDEGMNSDHR